MKFRHGNRKRMLVFGAVLLLFSVPMTQLISAGMGERETAEVFPSKPITVVVPWAAGGAAEIGGRIFASHLSEELGVRVDVVARPGGTGATGTISVKNAPADGYTILQTFIGPFAQVPLYLGDEAEYNPLTDFHPLGRYSIEPVVFLGPKNGPWKNMADFIEDARRHPGRYKVGAGGALSLHYLFAAMLFEQEGVRVDVVPYPGALMGIPDLLGGDLHVIAGNPTGVGLYPDDLIGLGTLLDERFVTIPDIPTMAELGFDLPPIPTWAGYSVRANTPEDIKRKLEEAVREVITSQAFQNEMLDKVDVYIQYGDPESFYQLWADSFEYMREPIEWLLEQEAKQ